MLCLPGMLGTGFPDRELMGAAAADQFDYALKVGKVGGSRVLLHDAELAEEMSEVVLAKNGNAFRG